MSKKKSIVLFILIFIANTLLSQIKLEGIIYDEKGVLPYATVRIERTNNGVLSDENGNYTLVISDTNDIKIVFSYIGKKSQTIIYNGQKRINVKLESNNVGLGEAVIYARPNINEIDVRSRTGSISEVNIRHIKNKPSSSIGIALQGLIPGLQIINRGELGIKPEVRIRGNSSFRKGDLPNEPLYILDGQAISSETFFTLNVEDIKNIKVLKDAVASALYGIKAANGVLEITSNRGFKGDRTISLSLKTGITLRGAQTIPMMQSREKLELERLLKNPAMPGYMYSEEYIRLVNPNNADIERLISDGRTILDSLSNINTNWYKKLLKINTYQTYTIGMRGGGEQTSYYSSIGFLTQGGHIKGNDYKRLSARISIDNKLSDRAILGLSINGSLANTRTPNGNKYPIENLVYQLNPYETEYSNHLYSFPKRGYNDLFNQFSRDSYDKTIAGAVSLNYNIIDGLELSAVGGFDFLLNEDISITPATSFDEIRSGIPKNERGKLSQYKNTTTNLTSNIRLTYNKRFEKHDITLGLNTDFYSTKWDNIGIRGRGLFGNIMSGAAIDNSISGQNRPAVTAKKELVRNIGFGILMGYTFMNKYDFFATYKIDASSVLPKKRRANTAWALGLGWDIKQEDFLSNINWINSLKLRFSYGYTANLQGVSAANTIATFRYTSTGYNQIRGLELMALANLDLKAEQNHILDYGFSANIYNTTLNLSIYRRTTKDALISIPIASSNGFLSQLRNVGILENSGLELSLSQKILESDLWYSRITINVSYNRNKVVSLYGKKRLYTNSESILPDFEVGQSTDIIFGLKSQGINPITGEPTFLTANNKEVDVKYRFKREDYVALGYSTPPMNGSILYNIRYGNIELDFDFYYTFGAKRKYSFQYVRDFSSVRYNAIKGQVNNMWFKSGDDDKIYHSPFISSSGIQNIQTPNTKNIGSTNMLRLNGLSIRYRLSASRYRFFNDFIKYVYIGVQASNLFTIKQYRESDPESGAIVAPMQPVITFSLNVSF